MNIVFLTPDFPPYAPGNRDLGGIGSWIHDFARGACEAGHACTVICFRTGVAEEESFDRHAPFRVVRVPPRLMRLCRDGVAWLHMRRVCRGGGETLFVAGTVQLCRLALRMKRFTGVTAGVLVHGNDILRARRNARMMRALAGLDFIAANSAWSRRIVEHAAGRAARVVTVNPFFDPGRFPGVSRSDVEDVREKYAPGARRVILTAARLARRKNHALVLEALPLVLARFPGTRYVIAGEGPMRARLEARAAALGVAEHVRFTGFVSQAELEALYRAADLFVMPTRETETEAEGFGIVFLEAAYFGLPVIGAASGGIPDAVEHGVSGLLVDPGSADELVGAVTRIFSDDALYRRMRDAARKRVERFFPRVAVPAALEAFMRAARGGEAAR